MSPIYRTVAVLFLLRTFSANAQWIEHLAPESGTINYIGFLGYKFFGINQNRFFSSYDGKYWEKTELNLPPSNYKMKIAGGKIFLNFGQSIGVSSDTGLTLQVYNLAAQLGNSGIIQLEASDSALLCCLSNNEIYRSTDSGQNWKKTFTIPGTSFTSSLARVGSRFLAFSNTVIYESTDDGKTWSSVTPSFLADFPPQFLRHFEHGDVLFLQMDYGTSYNLYRSMDSGTTWEAIPDPKFKINSMFESAGILYCPVNTNLDASSDNGDTWTPVEGAPYSVYGLAAGNGLQVASTSDGVFRWLGNHAWEPGTIGVPGSSKSAWGGQLTTNGNSLLYAGANNIYRSGDLGTSWQWLRSNSGATEPPAIYADSVIVLADGVNYRRSTDHGATWQIVDNLFPPGFTLGKLWFDGIRVYFSSSSPVLYRANLLDSYFGGGVNYPTTHLLSNHVAVGPDKILYLGYNNAVYTSNDAGNSWTNTTSGLDTTPVLKGGWGTGTGLFFVQTKKNLYRLVGDNWEHASGGLLDGSGNLTVTPTKFCGAGDTVVLLGVDAQNLIKMYYSQDAGANWGDISVTLPAMSIKDMILCAGRIFISGYDADKVSKLYSLGLGDFNFKEVSGQVFNDENANGQLDAGEKGLPNALVKTLVSNTYAKTDSGGNFKFFASPATLDSLEAIPPGKYASRTTPPALLDFNAGAGLLQGIHFQPNIHDQCISLSTAYSFSPGQHARVFACVKNVGTDNSDGTWLWLTLPPQVQIEAVIPNADHVSGDTLFWMPGKMEPFDSRIFEVRVRVHTWVQIGEELQFTAQTGAAQADADPKNNEATLTETVVKSFDPNEKKCEPEHLSPQMLLDNSRLTYTVRFQNTGNYPAAFVKVLDTLDLTALDISSLEILNGSHPFTWDIRRQNVLEFSFANIDLPDSTRDEPGSHGFVRFSILPKKTLQPGDVIQNQAFIYFDFNAAVTTNIVQTAVQMPDLTYTPRAAQFNYRISPNPGRRDFNLIFDAEMEGAVSAWVTDAAGREVWAGQKTEAGKVWYLPLSGLKAGQYLISVRCKAGLASRKLVVVE